MKLRLADDVTRFFFLTTGSWLLFPIKWRMRGSIYLSRSLSEDNKKKEGERREGEWKRMTAPSFHKNCPPWKPARLPTDIHPRRHFFANFNRHCRARWQSFSLASHTPMRFFISPWQCIPVRQPRGDIATHEGRRRDGECGNELGEERDREGAAEGRGGPGGRGRETFLITSRRYRLCLSPQLLAISCQIFPACHWMAFAFTIHPPPLPPFCAPDVVSIELLLIVTVSRLRYDFCIYIS